MTRLAYLLLGLLSWALTVSAWDQEKMDRDANCDNDCFFGSFPGGSCTTDAACMCTQQKYRERYFCCMAKKCDEPQVLSNSTQRQFVACEAHGVPIPEDFDTEAVCGITLSTTSTTAPSTSTSSGSSASKNTEASTTDGSAGAEESSDATGSSSGAEPSGDGADSDDNNSLGSRPILGSTMLIGTLVAVGLTFLL